MTDEQTGAEVWKRLFGKGSDTFLDHAWEPQNVGEVENADVSVSYTGPCGDTICVSLREQNGRIHEIRFLTDGCEATLACSSAMTVLAWGKSLAEAVGITASSIKSFLGGLPKEHEHCAALAAAVLHQALVELIRKMRKEE
ncbi:iron-sulfur cluster assembly scaffold protein [candidate division TA06 bacterium B3_TA06]|uniref:Iron-sulfur cluster assembly scaffold protein n=1 Tax=candidate division TA06 bacterium B3_TA06 TaxID=2012487 RepID=A0A532V6M7_UNCT6|nr:MAG: iron-sulfur cluster assembly scaffold protein [candidate division TA06 bacterium B3_TA06]